MSALLLTTSWAGAAGAQDNTAQALPAIGTPGGTPFTRQCPGGQVLTGIRARLGLVIDALAIKCRPVNANGALGAESNVGTFAGGSKGFTAEGSCPAGAVVSGQSGNAAAPVGIALLELRCRPWDAASRRFTGGVTGVIHVMTGPGGPSIVVKSTSSLGPAAVDCARQTQPAVLLRGRSGDVIDAAALTCDEP